MQKTELTDCPDQLPKFLTDRLSVTGKAFIANTLNLNSVDFDVNRQGRVEINVCKALRTDWFFQLVSLNGCGVSGLQIRGDTLLNNYKIWGILLIYMHI